ncbi:MaoC family dehydratase [Aliirhizobium terrae]|uniref:MaoC family dehydratase n=1 Tax=Terrirhizobium terrae TaxID=2926709 RepID=UPI00257879E4|nr:MaoC family dehydratase [Rhizobium sp. CC-CFT758]WJH40405.1 MaoC family dehydratase [Rhizobium sp. CC-CFT758]
MLYLEDFTAGRVLPLASQTMRAEAIIAFASEFDPQAMHLDEEAGKASILGGLSASGWHTASVFMRMMYDGWLADSSSEGSPGIDFMEWKKPVLAGDRLSGRSTVIEARRLQSRPGIGLVRFLHEVTNQNGDVVMRGENPIMFRARTDGSSEA